MTSPMSTAKMIAIGMRNAIPTSPHFPRMPARSELSIGVPSAWRV